MERPPVAFVQSELDLQDRYLQSSQMFPQDYDNVPMRVGHLGIPHLPAEGSYSAVDVLAATEIFMVAL